LLAGWISFPSHVSGVESSGVEGNTHDRRLQSVRRERGRSKLHIIIFNYNKTDNKFKPFIITCICYCY
jgi:hypothetical protein